MIETKSGRKLKVALVHDYLNQYGGAERVLECFAEMFPDAPIYTLFYDKNLLRGKFKDRVIKTSFLDSVLVSRHHRLFIPFFPKAAELLDLGDDYDLIISDSHGFSKGITHGKGFHISYVHAPLRYAWEPEKYLSTLLPKFLIMLGRPILNYVRKWDYAAAQKPNLIIANSEFTARKIRKWYDRGARVVYPPVDNSFFYFDETESKNIPDDERYFIAFGRMLHYKRFDLIIEAFNQLGLPLILVGTGPDKERLAQMIKSPKIKMLSSSRLDDDTLGWLIRGAEALIFPQVEDFGLVAAEAVSSGVPVIAYSEGGAKEIVNEGENGLLFIEQTPEAIIGALKEYKKSKFDRRLIAENAKKFSKENFQQKIMEIIGKHASAI